MAKAKVPAQKPGAPGVVVDKSGHRVRLRNIDHALPVCLSIEGKGEMRYNLEPNKWIEVPDEVYQELKRKFYKPQEFEVPDWDPRGDADSSVRTPRIEGYEEYTIEFPEERD